MAWNIAALMRQEKLPKLATLLIDGPRKGQPARTWEDDYRAAQAWVASFG